MKNLITPQICFISIFFFGFVFVLKAQIPEDPLKGSHTLIKSAEAFLLEIKNDESYSTQSFDFGKSDYSIQPWGTSDFPTPVKWSCMDAITADLNGDNLDEIIMVQYAGTSQKAFIGIYQVIGQKIELKSQLPAFDCMTDADMATTQLVKGNFVDDAKEEFAIAYMGTDSKLHVIIYEVKNESMMPNKIAENSDLEMAEKEKDNLEYDYTGDLFDLTAFDYDRDALDEIVLVHKIEVEWEEREFFFQTVSYDYEGNSTSLNTQVSDLGPIVLDYGDGPGYYKNRIVRISMPSLANGDVDHNGTREIAFGFIVHQQHNYFPFLAEKADFVTIQMLEIDNEGKVGFFNGPNLKLIDNHNQRDHGQDYGRHRYTLTVACEDLDHNGVDEVICNGLDSLFVLSYTDMNKLEQITGVPCNNHGYFFDHRGPSFVIADVNFDTAATSLSKEIVYMKYLPGPLDSWGQKLGEINLGIAAFEEGKLMEKDVRLIRSKEYSNANELRYLLALGEFDGDALHIGAPDPPIILRDIEEPRIIVNAPPVQGDVFNDQAYDICSAFDGSNDFITIYSHKEGQANELQTEIVRDWGASASLRKVLKVSETGIDASFEGRYGEHFSNLDFESESYETILTVPASLDDWIYTTVTDYYLWEYPVYFNQEEIGRVMVVFPDYKGGSWIPSKSQSATHFLQHHEFGNILSYGKLSNVPDEDTLKFNSPFIELNNESGKSWSVNIQKINENQFSKNRHFGFSSEVLLSEGGKIGIDIKFVSFDIEAKTEFGVKGHYDQSEIVTTKMSVTEGIDVQINFGALDKHSFGEVNYEVKPYAYWSTNGAFVIDYITEPIKANSWWADHYAQQPDLAFILPWKYDVEKNLLPSISKDKQTQTKDLIFVPTYLEAGDTVGIITRIHIL